MDADRCPTCLQQGLTAGYAYATAHGEADRLALGRVVRAHSADEVKANLDRATAAPAGVDHPTAYWSGFAHGVGRFLSEQGRLGADAAAEVEI